ncbi:MAG: DUF2258 domain-containing protein [Fervidicoccaceae archaeon]
MFVVKTGPVRTSGFALKLRRSINAALREAYKDKKISPTEVNKALTDINKILYELIVSEFSLPKDTVINIQITFDILDGKLSINDISIEVFVKDEILSKAITNKMRGKALLTSTTA